MKLLIVDEFEEAFKSLKRSKAPCHDGLNVNIITSVYELIKKPLRKIFNESITPGIFDSDGNTNFQIWQKKKLLTKYFRTFVFL